MINFIQGKLIEASMLQVTIDVGGLGYEVSVPLTTAEKLPALGQIVKLFTSAIYREDSQALYGFSTRDERDFFKLLIEKVSGVGPKIALSIFSKLSLPVLQNAIAQGNVSLLAGCHGIGKKTAERLVIELKDKVSLVHTSTVIFPNETTSHLATSTFSDAVAALITLGFKPADADKSIRKAITAFPEAASTQELIKKALS